MAEPSPWSNLVRYLFDANVGLGSVRPPSLSDYKSVGHDVLTTAKNLPGSTIGVLKDMASGLGHAIAHPLNTIGAVGELGGSAYEKAFPTAGLSAAQHAHMIEPANAAIASLADPWSTVDKAGNRHFDSQKAHDTITQDPASVLLDAASFLPMGGGALKAAGLASKIAGAERVADALGTAGKVLSTTGNAVNPIGVAGKVIGAPTNLARHYWEMQSGIPARLMQEAEKAAYSGGQSADLFNKFRNGQGSPQEMHQPAVRAIQAIKKDVSDQYLQDRQGIANQSVDMTPVFQALQDQHARLGKGAATGFEKAKEALGHAENLVFDVATNPDPAARTIDHLDSLKQQIYDLHDQYPNKQASNVLDSIYHATRNAMAGVDPAYTDLMEHYQTSLNNLGDLQRSLGATQNVDASKAVARMMRNMKTPMGQSLLDQLAEKEPTLMPMLAGEAMRSPVATNPIQRLTAAGTIAGGGLSFAGTGNPWYLAAPVAGIIAQSPRLAASANYGLGKLKRIADTSKITPVAKTVDALTPDLPQAAALAGEGDRIRQNAPSEISDIFKPEFYTGHVDPEISSQPTDNGAPLNYSDVFGDDDREAHASGGKVGHQHLVDRLMKLANKAKRDVDQASKPLLQADDSSVAHALAIANRGI